MLSSFMRHIPLARAVSRTPIMAAVATSTTATAAPSTFAHSQLFLDQHQVRSYRSNRSRRGLYDGKDIRTGNNVSFSMRHTKRTFKPNVFIKRVYSDILDGMIKFHLTASTLRSIDKAGGIDNYLMKNEFTEGEGYQIKKKMLKRLKNQAYLKRKADDAGDQVPATPNLAGAAEV